MKGVKSNSELCAWKSDFALTTPDNAQGQLMSHFTPNFPSLKNSLLPGH